MKKILVPTDLSEISVNALKLAVEVAEKSRGEIYLVNFLDHPLGRGFNTMGEVDQQLVDEENFYMIKLIKKTTDRVAQIAASFDHTSIKIHHEVFDEDFDDGIVMYAKEKEIDLVVMGTTGEESAEEIFTGNHTERTIEKVGCPVLSIKENHGWSNLKHIVLGVDLDQTEDDKMDTAIGYLNDFAVSLDAKIDVVHVANTGKASRSVQEKQLVNFADRHGLLNYNVTVTENDDKEQGLIAFALAKNAGVLSVLSYTDGGFFKIFSKSTSVELSKDAQLPVLTINLNNI
ncbi:MAG: universal stress protein [Bacteroidota bacterium]